MSHGEGIPAPARSGNDSSRLLGRTELGVPHAPPPITSLMGTQGKCRVCGEPRGGTLPPLVPRRWPSPQLLAAVPSRGAQT